MKPKRLTYKHSTEKGFSLLEMIVAVSILGISVVSLYKAVAGATHATRVDEKYLYAVELAKSVLADNAVVEPSSRKSGETSGGFNWSVTASDYPLTEESALETGELQEVEVIVAWDDDDKQRQVRLVSVVSGISR